MTPSAVEERNQAIVTVGLVAQKPTLAVLIAGIIGFAVLFMPEIRSAVEVWDASTAYSHCYLVLPMTLYLLWERREVLRRVSATSEARIALVALPVAIVWLMAERLGFMEGRQLAAIAGFQVFLCAVLGRTLFWRLSGPLLFLFFLVPFGAFLTPALQWFTAAFSIAGLNLLGIPNFSDRFTIETPAGVFFVAEACAGLRFLIAAIAFGVFYAILSYTSPLRRAGFVAASIVVPIVANGFRALGIVVLGQVLGSAEAAAADHIIYGWLFFSIVMLLLIAAGQVFREDTPAVQMPIVSAKPVPRRSAVLAGLGALVLLGFGPAVAGLIDSRASAPSFSKNFEISIPQGCAAIDASGPASQRMTTMNCWGTLFEVRLNLFAARSTSSAMVAERRRLTQEIGAENVTVVPADAPVDAGRWTIVQTTDPDRVTAYASWVDGAPVQSGTAGRIAQARDSLVGGDHAAALLTITSVEPAKSLAGQRKTVMDRLLALVNGQAGLDGKMAEYTRLSTHE